MPTFNKETLTNGRILPRTSGRVLEPYGCRRVTRDGVIAAGADSDMDRAAALCTAHSGSILTCAKHSFLITRTMSRSVIVLSSAVTISKRRPTDDARGNHSASGRMRLPYQSLTRGLLRRRARALRLNMSLSLSSSKVMKPASHATSTCGASRIPLNGSRRSSSLASRHG